MGVTRDDQRGGLKRRQKRDTTQTPPRPTKTYVDTTHGTLHKTTVALPPARPLTHHEALAQAREVHQQRKSATTYPTTSGLGALVAATGGEASYDRAPAMRPEDLRAVRKASRHSPGVHAVGELLSDPSGAITLGRAIKDVVSHPGPGSELGAGLAAAGLFVPGLRRLRKTAKVAEEAASAPGRGEQVFETQTRRDVVAPPDAANNREWQQLVALENYDTPLGTTEYAKLLALREKFSQEVQVRVPVRRPATAPGKSVKAGAAAPHVAEAEHAVAPEGAKEVAGSLTGAAKLRREQEKLYSKERSKRIATYEATLKKGLEGGLDPEEAHRIASKSLAGELPKLQFLGGKELNRDNLPDLFKHIGEHPDLRLWERKRTRDALFRIFDGKVPTKSEIKLLGTAFGEVDAHALTDSVGLWKKLGNTSLQVLNAPRAMKSSYDLSAPFRQGLVLGARHPLMFASEFKPMLKAFRSEHAYNDVMEEIAARPTFRIMEDSKLALTDLENITNREEAFASNIAEYVPGVRASGRAYVAFLNKFRADAFDAHLKFAEAQGHNISDPNVTASIARFINYTTGRGGQSKFVANHAVGLGAALFSPRLIASRVNLLANPKFYHDLDPYARKEALRSMGQLLGGVSLTLWMAKLAGAKVGVDPRSSDFGKIRVGNTRVDILGGFQQYIVFGWRMLTGETVSSSTGQVEHLTGGFGKASRGTLAARFLHQKMAPVPGFIWGAADNENFAGQPFDVKKEAAMLFAPLGPQNAVQTYKSDGPAAAAIGLGLGSIGFGVNTYGAKSDTDLKNNLKIIDKAVQTGQLTAEEGAQAKHDLQRVHYLETHDSKENRRKFVIDEMVGQGYSHAEINQALHELGYEPVGP